MTALLELHNIVKTFRSGRHGVLGQRHQTRAVDEVSLIIGAGQTVGLVGESGSGKSTLGRIANRLLDPSSGRVSFDGVDITDAPYRQIRAVRSKVSMVFQDPLGSLNPRQSVHQVLANTFRAQQRQADRAGLVELLADVGLSQDYLERYPHQLSGGQRQRVAIARALAGDPKLIIADEPTSALDASVRAQILNLMADLQSRRQLSFLHISHDLAVVRLYSDMVAVMYQGQIVEYAPAADAFDHPRHPYTATLRAAVLDGTVSNKPPLPAAVVLDAEAVATPTGCIFRPRCWKATDICMTQRPALTGIRHQVACYHPLTDQETATVAGSTPSSPVQIGIKTRRDDL